jgi:hypothetical protein
MRTWLLVVTCFTALTALGCGRVDNSAIAPENPAPPPTNVNFEPMQGSGAEIPKP